MKKYEYKFVEIPKIGGLKVKSGDTFEECKKTIISEAETPYWRTMKANGELNEKYSDGVEAHKEKLETEGHTIIQKGRKNIRDYVKDYKNALFVLK